MWYAMRMSYIVLKVYSFECDHPDCGVSNVEILPLPGEGLRGALKELRRTERWTTRNGKHYCPKHPV